MSTKATIPSSSVCLSALTDVGSVREHNEDNFIVCPDLEHNEWYLEDKPFSLSPSGCLLVVADGMGGANAGEVASQIAVDSIKSYFSGIDRNSQLSEKQEIEYLQKAILHAHKAIVDHAATHPDCEGMGTTIVIAWVKSSKAVIAWCGDSRGYLYRPGEGLKIVTKDHSLVWEMVEAGKLTPEEADVHPNSNIITQSLGDPESIPKPDVTVVPLHNADKLLLCSDGLNNMVDIDGIESLISSDRKLKDINANLIETANQNGGKDNITLVSLEIKYKTLPVSGKESAKAIYKPILASSIFIGLLLIALSIWINKGHSDNVKQATVSVKENDQNQATVLVKENDQNQEAQIKDTLELKSVQADVRKISDETDNRAVKTITVKQVQPTNTEVPVPNADYNVEEVDERINRINRIITQRDELAAKANITETTDAPKGEGNFYKKDVEEKRSQILDALDSVVSKNEWQKIVAEDSTRSSFKKKWLDFKILDTQLDSADAAIERLRQLSSTE